MNKRIKKKVTKRVLIKIKNKQPLSKFETNFFTKNILPTFIETFTAVRKALEKALPTVIKIATERVNELSKAMEEAEQSKTLNGSNMSLNLNTGTYESTQYQVNEVDTQRKVSAGEDDLQLNTDSIEKLDKDILGTKERISTGVLNAENIDVSNIHLVTPESHREIKTTIKGLTYSSTAFSTEEQLKSAVKSMNSIGSRIIPKPLATEEHSQSLLAMDKDNNIFTKKETKWQKAKGKVKGWFGK